jgi:hypothetical protein
MGKTFCPYEGKSFPDDEFEVVDGNKVHRTHPLHSGIDGRLIEIVNGKVHYPKGIPSPVRRLRRLWSIIPPALARRRRRIR